MAWLQIFSYYTYHEQLDTQHKINSCTYENTNSIGPFPRPWCCSQDECHLSRWLAESLH